MSDLPYADEGIGTELRTLENAVGILQLRLCRDPWANERGRRMVEGATNADLLAHIATTALALRERITDAP